jgi:predicted Na+-dependent transporter
MDNAGESPAIAAAIALLASLPSCIITNMLTTAASSRWPTLGIPFYAIMNATVGTLLVYFTTPILWSIPGRQHHGFSVRIFGSFSLYAHCQFLLIETDRF